MFEGIQGVHWPSRPVSNLADLQVGPESSEWPNTKLWTEQSKQFGNAGINRKADKHANKFLSRAPQRLRKQKNSQTRLGRRDV